MTDIAVNKGLEPFQLSVPVYRNLILNYGWRHLGVFDMNREMTTLRNILISQSAGIVPVITLNGSGLNGTIALVEDPADLVMGGSAHIEITPSSGYYASNVIIDGYACGAGADMYTITGLNNNHIIEAAFYPMPAMGVDDVMLQTFRTAGGEVSVTGTTGMTPIASAHGMIIYDSTDYTFSIDAKAYSGFTIDQVYIDGVLVPHSGTAYNVNFASTTGNPHPEKFVIYFKPIITLDIPVERSTKLIWQDTRGRWYCNILDFDPNWQYGRADPDLISAIKQVKAAAGASGANGGNAIIQIITIPSTVTEWMIVKDCNGKEIVTTTFEKWDY